MRHHTPDDILVLHSRGELSIPKSILIEVHLTTCPLCRRRLAIYEEVAAEQLLASDEAPLPPFQALLGRLNEPEPAPRTVLHPDLPAPLAQVEFGSWRWLAPFTRGRAASLETEGDLPLLLIEMSAGARLHHLDGGTERAAILSGGWTDQDGQVQAGDLVWHDPHEGIHEQRIDDGEPCLALVLNDAKTTPTGLIRPFRSWFKV